MKKKSAPKKRKARKFPRPDRGSRNKESKDIEYYKGIIRELEKAIRSLQSENKRLNKHEHMHENLSNEPYYEPIEDNIERCQFCKTGIMQSIIIANRIIKTCNSCGKRLKAIKL